MPGRRRRTVTPLGRRCSLHRTMDRVLLPGLQDDGDLSADTFPVLDDSFETAMTGADGAAGGRAVASRAGGGQGRGGGHGSSWEAVKVVMRYGCYSTRKR